MKVNRRKAGSTSPQPASQLDRAQMPVRLTPAVLACALAIGWILYSPALNAPFVFDDSGLPFARTMREAPVSAWLSGVRPALMLTYWLNRTLWGDDNQSYHAVNLLIHTLNTGLVFLVLWRLLQLAKWELPRVRLASILGSLI